MPVSAFIKAAPRGLTVAVIMAFAILCGLGIWQIQRLHWKEGLIADLARTHALPPAPVDQVLATAHPEWRAVVLPPCAINPEHMLYMHSQASGQPGYRALAACPVPGGAILTDLGFVADDVTIGNLPDAFTPVGRLRPLGTPGGLTPHNNPAGRDWYWRSAADMGPALNATLRNDEFVVLDLKASHLSVPGLEQGELIAPLANRHLEYALTWFGLATALLGVYIGVVVQRMRQIKPE